MSKVRSGFVYILSNPSMDGILKVGLSQRVPEKRVLDDDLNSTGVPTPFCVEYYSFFEDVFSAEKQAHALLADSHWKKEFFKVEVSDAVKAIERIPGYQRLFLKNSGFFGSTPHQSSGVHAWKNQALRDLDRRAMEAMIEAGAPPQEAERDVRFWSSRKAPTSYLPSSAYDMKYQGHGVPRTEIRGDSKTIGPALILPCLSLLQLQMIDIYPGILPPEQGYLLIYTSPKPSHMQDVLTFARFAGECNQAGRLERMEKFFNLHYLAYSHDFPSIEHEYTSRYGDLLIHGRAQINYFVPASSDKSLEMIRFVDNFINNVRGGLSFLRQRELKSRYRKLSSLSAIDLG